MINSHLLYRLSYRGTSFPALQVVRVTACFPPSEARHFTVLDAAVNRKNAIYYNDLHDAVALPRSAGIGTAGTA